MNEATVKLSEDEFRRAERAALYPDTDLEVYPIFPLKLELRLRPLPIAIAKKINARMDEVQMLIAKRSGESKTDDKDVEKFRQYIGEIDVATIESLLDVAVTLFQFYGVQNPEGETHRSWIENYMSGSDLKSLIEAQLKRCNDNDFLLQPLRSILELVDEGLRVLKNIAKLSFSTPSAMPGGFPSTNSLPDTPGDSSS